MQHKFPVTSHRGMLERLDHAHIRVLQRSVFPDKDNGHRIEQPFLP